MKKKQKDKLSQMSLKELDKAIAEKNDVIKRARLDTSENKNTNELKNNKRELAMLLTYQTQKQDQEKAKGGADNA